MRKTQAILRVVKTKEPRQAMPVDPAAAPRFPLAGLAALMRPLTVKALVRQGVRPEVFLAAD